MICNYVGVVALVVDLSLTRARSSQIGALSNGCHSFLKFNKEKKSIIYSQNNNRVIKKNTLTQEHVTVDNGKNFLEKFENAVQRKKKSITCKIMRVVHALNCCFILNIQLIQTVVRTASSVHDIVDEKLRG